MRQLRMILAVVVLGLGLPAFAQTSNTQTSGTQMPSTQPAGRGRNFTVAQLQRIQDAMQATDDEWKVIQPKVEKIESLRRGIQSSRFGLRGRRGAPAVPAVKGPASPVAPAAPVVSAGEQTELQAASQQLQEALNNKNTQPADLKAKLVALREARARAQADFTTAQDDLREILTARQEAVLVTLGLLN